MKQEPPALVKLTIKPAAGFSGEPLLRLRQLLKRMLRDYGWRCVRAESVEPDAENRPGGAAAGCE